MLQSEWPRIFMFDLSDQQLCSKKPWLIVSYLIVIEYFLCDFPAFHFTRFFKHIILKKSSKRKILSFSTQNLSILDTNFRDQKKKLNDNHHVNQRKLKYHSRLKFTWLLVCSRTGFLPPFMIKYNYYMLCFNTYLQLTKKGMKTTYVSLTASIICRSFISCFPSSVIKKMFKNALLLNIFLKDVLLHFRTHPLRSVLLLMQLGCLFHQLLNF